MKQNQQSLAKDLYLHTDKTQQEIANILDVNRRTVYLWIKIGRWEEMKIAARQAPGIILQDMYNHITAVNDRIRQREEGDRDPTMQEVEKLRKLVNITTSIQKRNVGSYMEAFQELLAFIARRDQALVGKIVPHVDKYIKGNFGDKIFHASKERDENVRDVVARLKKEEEEMADVPHLQSVVTSPAPADPVTPDLPTAPAGCSSTIEGQSCDTNEIFCDKNLSEILETQTAQEEAKPATTEYLQENEREPDPGKSPAPEILENGIFSPSSAGALAKEDSPAEILMKEGPSAEALAKEEQNGTFVTLKSELEKTNFDRIMELPPAERPSPWRDESIIWVTNIDHLEYRVDNFGNPWGEIKMSDTIHHYPDVDPAILRDQAFAQMMKEMYEQDNRNRSAA